MAAFLSYRSASPSTSMRLSPSPSPSPSFRTDLAMDDNPDADDGVQGEGEEEEYYDSDMEREPSLYSYSSSRDGARFVREVHGRVCNAQNELYSIPADDEEVSRLGTQHQLLKIALDSNYVAPHLIKRALTRPFPPPAPLPQFSFPSFPPQPNYPGFPQPQHPAFSQQQMSLPFNFPGLPRQPHPAGQQPPRSREKRAILDCGTGAGFWAVEMALEWPDVEVVGVDLAPQFRKLAKTAPPNCRFEIDDVTLGLPHFKGAFDLVHSRSIGNGISDYPAYIEDLLLTLRTGGILLLVEGDLQLRNHDGRPTDPDESAMQRILWAAYNALKGKGSTVDAGRLSAGWLKKWVGKEGGVTFVGEDMLWVPIGPWLQGNDDRTRRLNYVGELMRRDSKIFMRSLRPTLIEAGYPTQVLDQWIEETDRELDALSVRMYVTWHYAWGEKAEGELVRRPVDE